MSYLSTAEKNILKNFCNASSIPTILLNDDLICEYSNNENFYRVGIHFASVQVVDTKLEKDKTVKTMVLINEKYYCAMITPVSDELYICQMFDSDNIFEMAQYSEVSDQIRPLFSSNGVYLERIEDEFKKLLNLDEIKENYKIDSEMLALASEISMARGRFEEALNYFDVSFSKKSNDKNFSIYKYVKWCVDKYNSLLANLGRFIKLDCNDTTLRISADSRYAVLSFIELIQFILLNSSKEFDPFISIRKYKEYVEFMITCRGLIFIQDGKEDEFIGSDVSSNVTMARRFAKRSKAHFKLVNENDNIIGFRIFFPEAVDLEADNFVLEDDEFVDFDKTYQRYIEYKMQDVIKAWKLQNNE